MKTIRVAADTAGRLRLLFLLSALALVGCGDSDGDSDLPHRSEQGNFFASAIRGSAPLDVEFELSGRPLLSATLDYGDGSSDAVSPAGSVRHTFASNGTYMVTLNATELDGDRFTDAIRIRVGEGSGGGADPVPGSTSDVNLVITSFAIDDTIDIGIDVGEPVVGPVVAPVGEAGDEPAILGPLPSSLAFETVSAIVQNVGAGTLSAGTIEVGFFLSTDPEVTVDDIFIGEASIVVGDAFFAEDVQFGMESLGPGENYQFNIQLAPKRNLPVGTYYAGAIVDFVDDYDWYTFARATDTLEYEFSGGGIAESDETDNVRVLEAHQVQVINGASCAPDSFEDDDGSAGATPLAPGASQRHNFCLDNADWFSFEAVAGGVYKIATDELEAEADTQLILYDRDGSTILLFHDNVGNDDVFRPDDNVTVDLGLGMPSYHRSEIVWEAEFSGTYFVRARATSCDEDFFQESVFDPWCRFSFDGPGLQTGYTISLQ